MSRGFESHRLRQRQHPAGCCFLFLQQTMQGLQGGIRTARARRFASRRAKMPRWGIFRARETPTICAISAVESKDFTADIFYFLSQTQCFEFVQQPTLIEIARNKNPFPKAICCPNCCPQFIISCKKGKHPIKSYSLPPHFAVWQTPHDGMPSAH